MKVFLPTAWIVGSLREEVVNWWKQALRDLEAARKNVEVGEYYVAAFLVHQAVEKALKALCIHKHGELEKTHSLISLGRRVGVPEDFHSLLRRIAPDFVMARYPNAAHGLPYELYDVEIVKERVEIAERVLRWVEENLKS